MGAFQLNRSVVGVRSVMSRALVGFVLGGLLVACGGGGSSDNSSNGGSDTIPRQDVSVSGAAVKGLQKNAIAKLYIIDYLHSELKGELIVEGRTDENGVLQGLVIPALRLADGPFLIEYSGGTELNGSATVIPTLRTILTVDQARFEQPAYATPLTTFALEMARINADPNAAQGAESNFMNELEVQQDRVVEYFGLGSLGGLKSSADGESTLFNTPPILTMDSNQDALALNYRIAIEVMSVMVNQLDVAASDVSADNLLKALAGDFSDGSVDGYLGGGRVEGLASLSPSQVIDVFTQDNLGDLVVPGTAKTISELGDILKTESIVAREITPEFPVFQVGLVVPGDDADGDGMPDSLVADPDGDGVLGAADYFPFDATKQTICDAGDEVFLQEVGCNINSDNDIYPDPIDACPFDDNDHLDSDGNGVCDNAQAANLPPVPRINGLETVVVMNAVVGGDAVLLDATQSSDLSSDALTFEWRCLDGPVGASLGSFSSDGVLSLGFSVAGTYSYQLTVKDSSRESVLAVTIVADQAETLPIVFDATMTIAEQSALPGQPHTVANGRLTGDVDHTLTLYIDDQGVLKSGVLEQDAWGLNLVAFFGLTADTAPTTKNYLLGAGVQLVANAYSVGLGSGTVDSNDATDFTGGNVTCNDVEGWGFCGSIPPTSGFDRLDMTLSPRADRTGYVSGALVFRELGASNTSTYTYSLTPR